ncbi:glycosyltransferase family 2 protein [Arenibaculum pallidiluteum]|uniref:glycosyltransferase family 2 protein n=1 Tax=Arenibaculum pallidiluteum TaxID=2812559 RepID=UPI001A977437|nr:glycosyltransferase family A protein [Arenibaculum pallidiluteum]
MISVVMPSYNSAAFVAEAIESVIRQTYPHWELLVCDDGSSDGTQDIVESYARADSRIRLLQHGFRSVSRNCNAAIAAARYPWIARLDADDVMVPRRLEWQMRASERDPAVVLWGGYARLTNREGRILRTAWCGPTTHAEYESQREAGRMMVILGPTVMFRRDLFLELGGYDPRFDSAEDLEFLSRIAERGPVLTLPRALTLYRLHGGSITAGKAAHQARLLQYIPLRNQARLAHRPEERLEEFLHKLDAAPVWSRAAEWLSGRSRQHYRNAVIHAAESRFAKAAAAVTLAVLMGPGFCLPRINARLARSIRWRQGALARRVARIWPQRPAVTAEAED